MTLSRNLKTFVGIAWKIAILLIVLGAAHHSGKWAMGQLSAHLTPSTEPMLHRLIMTATIAYVLLMMLPFVPGVEIGLGMIAILGPKIAPLVYGSTVLALSLAFLIGHLLPEKKIIEILKVIHLNRAANLLSSLEGRVKEDRLHFLFERTSSKFFPILLRHRFIALMLILNLPGNAILGGGGGICLIAGFSRLFPFHQFLAAIAIAVAPVPLFFLVAG